jgi:pyridoxine 5-phosphate synthase
MRLGFNIDHVATLRNARGGLHPDPFMAAKAVIAGGADSITVHLREDRRHIRDSDVERLRRDLETPINLEIAATQEMMLIAKRLRPHAVCIVPEQREEITTEGGLNAAAEGAFLQRMIAELSGVGITVALFIDPELKQIEATKKLGAAALEFHTGCYANSKAGTPTRQTELKRLQGGAALAASLQLEVHAGHGLDYENVSDVAAIAEIVELNIGHYLVGDALFVGLTSATRRMKDLMLAARRVS